MVVLSKFNIQPTKMPLPYNICWNDQKPGTHDMNKYKGNPNEI